MQQWNMQTRARTIVSGSRLAMVIAAGKFTTAKPDQDWLTGVDRMSTATQWHSTQGFVVDIWGDGTISRRRGMEVQVEVTRAYVPH